MLQLFRIKPTPRGKDHPKSGPLDPAQLGGEWIDIKNAGVAAVSLDGLVLHHAAYEPHCRNPTWARVIALGGSLAPQKTLRVHAGQVRPSSVLRPEDVAGGDYHWFTGDDQYVWNNVCGDTAGLFRGSTAVDQASYTPNPPEGNVLNRVGNQFL